MKGSEGERESVGGDRTKKILNIADGAILERSSCGVSPFNSLFPAPHPCFSSSIFYRGSPASSTHSIHDRGGQTRMNAVPSRTDPFYGHLIEPSSFIIPLATIFTLTVVGA